MKSLLTSVLLLCSTVWSLPQGSVHFGNESSIFTDGIDRYVRFDPSASAFNPFGTNYAPAVSNLAPGLRAQLYYGASTATADSLVPVTTAPPGFRSSTSANAGAWIPSPWVFIDVPYPSPVDIVFNFEVRVWDIYLAPSYEAAIADPNYNGLVGKSDMVTQRYSFSFDTGLTELRGFSIGLRIPEPSAVNFALFGAVLMWVLRRKTKPN